MSHVTRRSRAVAAVAAVLLCPFVADARAEDAAEPAALAKVREAFAAYDEAMASGAADSIPAEKAVLDAAASPGRGRLTEHLPHPRFGGLVLHVLVDPPVPATAPAIVEAFRAWAAPQRVAAAVDLGALGDDAARAALAELAADPDVEASAPDAARVRAARFRAGDREVVAAVEKDLASKDPAAVAAALLLVGDARATRHLATASRLAGDGRALATPAASQWSVTTTTTHADGGTTTTSEPVALPTVGAVAVEAANRMCATTLPGFVAWWAEPERGPRFGHGPAGAKRLAAFLAEDAKAEKAKARRGLDAVARVLASLRPAASPETSFEFAGATFDRVWTVTATLGGAPVRHVVAADGTVTKR